MVDDSKQQTMSIEEAIKFYGQSYDWVMANVSRYVERAQQILATGQAKCAEQASYMAIDECF